MLTRVKIQNFKSIGESGVDLELKPLTFLVGPNGGGKSSILEGILLAFSGGGVQNAQFVAPWLLDWLPIESVLHTHGKSRSPVASIQVFMRPETGNLLHQVTYSLNEKEATYHLGGEEREPFITSSSKSGEAFEAQRTKVFLIQVTRGVVRLQEQVTNRTITSPGIQGADLVPYLAVLHGSNEFAPQLSNVLRWAERFGIKNLKAGVQTNRRQVTGLGADYMDPELTAALKLVLASSGSRQILTVIAQLLGCESGSLVMVEEPEISLHPQAQIDLMELFGEVIRDQKQIIATTHSHYLLMAIGYGVQQGWIQRDDVAVYHVEKKAETGTKAKLLELGKDGYLKDWVPSYNEVERRLMKAWPKIQAEQ